MAYLIEHDVIDLIIGRLELTFIADKKKIMKNTHRQL